MESIPPLKLPNSGSANIIGLLLAIIKFLLSSLAEHKTLIEQLKRQNIELTVRLNKVNRVFSPKTKPLQMKNLKIPKRKKREDSPDINRQKGIFQRTWRKKRSSKILMKLLVATAAKHPTSVLMLLTESQIRYS